MHPLRLVDDIRSFLQGSDQTLSDEVRSLAMAYAEACREANQRLRRCEEYLQKGLQTEALHLAQAEPPILETAAALDFPERSQWEEITAVYGLPAAPKLLLATAEALNEAYASVQPLEHLLRRHRRLALGRAPLPTRLEVMREIAGIDSGNALWPDDIRALETVRIRQLETEAIEVAQSGDLRKANTLLEEVRTTPWLVGAPSQVLQLLERSTKQKERENARAILSALEMDLHAAVAACDVPRVKELRERWSVEAGRAQLTPDDPLWERVGPAMEWLANQERQQVQERKQRAAQLDLEDALLQKKSRAELEQLYRAVLVYDGSVPKDLEERYRARLHSLDASARQRRKVAVLGAVIALMLVGLGIALWVFKEVRERQVAVAVQRMQKLLADGELDEAEEFMKGLARDNSGVADDPLVADQAGRLTAAKAKEQERAGLFQEYLKQAELATPGQAEPKALINARALARTPQDKIAVQHLTRILAERAQAFYLEREKEYQSACRNLEIRIQVVETNDSANEAQRAEWIATAQAELDGLMSKLLEGGAHYRDLVKQLKELEGRLDNLRQALAIQKQESWYVSQLSASLAKKPDGTDYAMRVQEYVSKFPTTIRARSFDRALKERELWSEIIEWNRLLGPRAADPFGIDPAHAADLANQVEQFVAAHPAFVDIESARKYEHVVKAIAQQHEPDPKSAAAELRETFSHFLIKNLWVVRTDKEVYYLPSDPGKKIAQAGRQPKPVNLHYLAGLDGNEKIKNLPPERVVSWARAPQSQVADKVLKMPANFADRTWDHAIVRIAQWVQETPDMDPVVRLLLLRKVVELGSRGSYPLTLALAEHLRVIQKAQLNLEKVAWSDPEAEDVEPVRKSAQKVLDQIPPLTPVLALAARHRQELAKLIGGSIHEVIGWLAWDKDKGWQCKVGGEVPGSATLFIVARDTSQQARWQPVGKLLNGKSTINAQNQGPLVEGRLVFMGSSQSGPKPE
jgi:hypothetical protein